MVAAQVSGSLIVRDKNLLMVYDEEAEHWNVPADKGEKGELSADTAERVAEECTGCPSQATKYKGKLKTSFEVEGEEHTWQPYTVEIEGEPENVEWVNVDDLHTKEVAKPLSKIMEKLKDKL